jgi:isoquinoline 1-oxidoreductase beta subunit
MPRRPAPVQLMWSREQDLTHGYYRPAVLARLRAELDDARRPASWTARYTSTAQGGSAQPPYAIPRLDVEQRAADTHLRAVRDALRGLSA